MLGKLVKYELKATGLVMLPLFMILIAASAALGLNIAYMSRNDTIGILSYVIIFVFIAAVLVVGALSVLLVLQRFYKNLLGEEGYLMFSLPVRTGELIASKLLTSLIWIAVAAVAGVLSGIVLVAMSGDWSEFMQEMDLLWKGMLTQGTTGQAIAYLCVFAIAVILGMLESIAKVYAAMAVGHQWGAHRIIGSGLAYIGFGIVETLLVNVVGVRRCLAMLLGADETGASGMMEAFGMGYGVLRLMLVVAVIGLVIYGLIAWRLLDRRLNLE